MNRIAKVILFTEDEFRVALKEFYKGLIGSNVDQILESGLAIIPDVIIEKGFSDLSANELFDIGDVFANSLFDMYGYQILTIAFISENGKTYIFDPKNTKLDVENVLQRSMTEELKTDEEIANKA